MAEYFAKIAWQRAESELFTDNKYRRAHVWEFDGGATIPASASPHIVALPYSTAENVDPEEAFVASLSSCHMLFFLSIAAKKQFTVDSYVDHAVGEMGKNAEGKIAMLTVTLRPNVTFSGNIQPTFQELEALHHQAHELCFIANSVKTEVITEIVM